MSWSDFHERTVFIDTAVEQAHDDPGWVLTFFAADSPEFVRLFSDLDGFLLALQHRWVNRLTARLDQAIEDQLDPLVVWLELAAANPGLRTLIDIGARRSLRLRRALDSERSLLAEAAHAHAGDEESAAC